MGIWAKNKTFFFKEKSNHIQPMFILDTKVDLLTAICLTKGWTKKNVFFWWGVGWEDMVCVSFQLQFLCKVSYQVLGGFSLPFPHGSWDQAGAPVPASWWHGGWLTKGLEGFLRGDKAKPADNGILGNTHKRTGVVPSSSNHHFDSFWLFGHCTILYLSYA